MSRISIDVTAEEHQRLKALAALQAKSIKEFVLASTLGAQKDGALAQDLAELEAILDKRLQTVRAGGGLKADGYKKKAGREARRRLVAELLGEVDLPQREGTRPRRHRPLLILDPGRSYPTQ